MFTWCYKPELDLKIQTDVKPCPCVTTPFPFDDNDEEVYKKPFLNKRHIHFYIHYKDRDYVIPIEKGFRWDGATVPRIFWPLIGPPSDPAFLNASMIHDILCVDHKCCGHDRKLSSLVLREMLLGSHVPTWRAYTMYFFVDLFQRFCGW